MFEKTLSDIVRGIRANKRDTGLYISQCIAEIKTELGSQDLYVKANALNKLTFLQMMGYPIENNAAFACVEVMASPRFAHKRIGYLAASQGFHNPTKRTTAEVILLTTNLFQKELKGSFSNQQRMYEAGLALNCVSNIVNADLARDLLPELLALSKAPTPPYLRKKTLLCLFKLFLQYPDALRIGFDAIQGALDETDSAPGGQVVASCAIHVVCELSHVHDARNYLHLAPTLFDLLTGSATNNWMLIKVVKLMGRLVPQEPRLARKLLEPLARIVRETQAKSLLYESVHTITLCLPYCTKADGSVPSTVPVVVQLCHQTLHELVQESDPNLKYLGLVGLESLLESQPKLLLTTSAPNTKPLILQALSDADGTIRTRALELLKGMTTRKNIRELMTQLLRQHVPQASSGYRKILIQQMMQLCSGSKYQYFDGSGDFEWYLDLLFELVPMVILTCSESTAGAASSSSKSTVLLDTDKEVATLLQHQLLDVALRVLPVRSYAVKKCVQVLLAQRVPPPILPSVAWIIGEYISATEKMDHAKIVEQLLKPNDALEASTVAILIQASMKVYAVSKRNGACRQVLERYLPYYQQLENVEVMERAFTACELLKVFGGVGGVAIPGAKAESNLLLGGGTTAPPAVSDSDAVAADLLLYLYRPEAMKPIGAKVQRKKRQQSQIPGVNLDNPEIDASVASEWLEDQPAAITMGAVGFTQQRPMETTSTVTAISSGPTMEGFGSSNAPSAVAPAAPHITTDSSAISFQHTNLNPQPSQSQQQRNDPFYLDSHQEELMDQQPSADQFGMIQLDDVDDDYDDNDKKKKKRSKKKKATKQPDLGIFPPNPAGSSNAATVVYASDDDEDGADLLGARTSVTKPSGFAKIDLTVADEAVFNDILPTREHRSVAANSAAANKPDKKGKKKKSKASKSKIKSTSSSNEQPVTDSVGDLLGFSTSSNQTPVVPAATAPTSNTISTAFDDLLSLDAPVPPAPVMTAATAVDPFSATSTSTKPATARASKKSSSLKKAKKLPWMKATLKLSSAEGMTDWTKVSVYYRVSGTTSATMVSFRADNSLDHMSLDDLSITWRSNGNSISFGTVGPDQSGEATAGPFSYNDESSNMEIRGALGTSTGARVPIKVSLPATLHLSPVEGLTQEDVMSAVDSSQWSLESAKLDINAVAAAKVGSILKSFFRAAQVEPSDDMAVGTLAASTGTGDKLFVLYKVKETKVKVDMKCSNSTMVKPFVADLKRLLL